MLATDEGRASFWAESAPRRDREIVFQFPDGRVEPAEVLEEDPPRRFVVRYFGSRTTFEVEPEATGGTCITVTAEDVPDADRCDVQAGWVSVLLCLKAVADHQLDLRNHHPQRTWSDGYVDN